MRKFTYDMFDSISPPTLILSTKYHKHLGNLVNVQGITNEFNMASHQEISFDVYKEMDGVKNNLWDQIVDFKYLFVPEHNEYYELQVDVDETNKTIKHVVGVSASECELGQKYLRDFHVNDETDIERDDYVPTVFYNYQNPDASLLDRVLHDKGQSWTIEHVDTTIAGIQRTFTADNATLYDFLTNTVAKEIGCLFLFNSVDRTISAYDLKCNCNAVGCGFRGEFFDACPKCGSTDFTRGYGTYQNVFVASENFANQISVDGDADSVKNCFKIAGGDDLITATVANLNPNRSNYIYRFSDDMKADMPSALVTKLDDYNTLYNSLKPTYDAYTLQYYDDVDEELRLHTTMMPDTPIPGDTTAEAELAKLMAASFTVAVQNLRSVTTSSADLAVQNYAKVLIDPRYTCEVLQTSLSPISGVIRTWTGKFKVTSLGKVDDEGNPDEATSDTAKSITINEDYEEFLQQKIEKSLDRKDAAFTTIFNIQSDTEFRNELRKYSLDRLNSFANTYQSVLEILVKQGVADLNVKGDDDLYRWKKRIYDDVYVPYYTRKGYIDSEVVVRQAQVDAAQAAIDEDNRQRRIIQNQLDLKKYLGDELYEIFTLYLREDTYSNSNYISDGLNNSEVIQKAQELYDAAESELYKASELQYSLSGTLMNFLNTEEFKNVKDSFEIGDWIVCRADDKLYRLRLINLGYSYDSPADMSVTFSNATRINNAVSDMADLFNKAESMATSYDYTAYQANQGDKSKKTLDTFMKIGLDSSLYNVLSGDNQEVTIDEHGITAKEFIDTLDDYSPEQLKMNNNIIAFTKDNWEHAALGLGKHYYRHYDSSTNEWITEEDYGLSAQFVQAGWIYGSEIASGHIYSDNYNKYANIGTHINLENGTFNFAGQGLVYNGSELYLGGFQVATDEIMTNNISIYADGRIISDYLVGQVDETESAEYHGEIFNTYANGALPWAKHQDIDMDNFTEFVEGNMDVKDVSEEETDIVWLNDGNPAYCTFYYNTARDLTNWNYLAYVINTEDKQSSSGTIRFAFLDEPPTGYDQLAFTYFVIDEENKEYRGGFDISSITGTKYIVVSATCGWNATIKKLQLANYIGQVNKAIGVQSHAEGNGTTASGAKSHSEGDLTTASGESSHSEGAYTTASGNYSHAEGNGTTASYLYAHSEGIGTNAISYATHAEGGNTRAGKVNGSTYTGYYAHAEGTYTVAEGNASHAEGYYTNVYNSYSHGEGYYNTIDSNANDGCHVEGYQCHIYSGGGVHAEGSYTKAYAANSNTAGCHVEGRNSEVRGDYGAHAEGYNTKAYADSSHTEGRYTQTGTSSGSSSSGWAAHAEGAYSKAISDASHAEGNNTTAANTNAHAEGLYTTASGYSSHSEGAYVQSTANYSHAEGGWTQANGEMSHSEGYNTIAVGQGSHSEGGYYNGTNGMVKTTAVGQFSHAEGQGSSSIGIASHSEGYATYATADYSHAEGNGCYATGIGSHAENKSNAYAQYCHSEGYNTIVTQNYGHSEGQGTGAHGLAGHSEGTGTTVTRRSQHVEGEYNIGDTYIPEGYDSDTAPQQRGQYVHIVGNGTDEQHRSNAYTLDWDGNAVYAGKVTVGANPTQAMDLVTKQYADNLVSDRVTDVLVDGTSVVTNHVASIILTGKQDVLTAGNNITITNNVISSTSDVVVTPKVSTGTNIADITVDGTTVSLYADVSGSNVVPNPQGTPTDTLETVSIEGTIFDIASGAITGTTAPTSQQGRNGSIYVQYDAADNSIKYVYCKINGVWSLFPFEYDGDTFVDDGGNSMETSDGDKIIFVN